LNEGLGTILGMFCQIMRFGKSNDVYTAFHGLIDVMDWMKSSTLQIGMILVLVWCIVCGNRLETLQVSPKRVHLA